MFGSKELFFFLFFSLTFIAISVKLILRNIPTMIKGALGNNSGGLTLLQSPSYFILGT